MQIEGRYEGLSAAAWAAAGDAALAWDSDYPCARRYYAAPGGDPEYGYEGDYEVPTDPEFG